MKTINCKRATQVQNTIAWLPPQNIGYTDICGKWRGKTVITPCPAGCECVSGKRRKVWKPRVWTWFGWSGGHYVWVYPQARCVPHNTSPVGF